jgi:hypothetical protein
MCNCKGWDVAFFQDDEITIVQHFCRVYDDCGHVDNSLEEVAEQVAREYNIYYDWYCENRNRDFVEISDERLDWFLEQSRLWKNKTHPDYLYYKEDVDKPEDGDTV